MVLNQFVVLLNFFRDALQLLRPLLVYLIFLTFLLSQLLPQENWVELNVQLLGESEQVLDEAILRRLRKLLLLIQSLRVLVFNKFVIL